MARILGISGSLRKGSYNSALLRAAAALAPQDAEVEIASIEGIPLYHGDVEASSGLPPEVLALKERIVASDGLLLVTPEYNNSIPGVLKNAIDWLSRPPSDQGRVFGGRPVGLIGASPGRMGTVLSQAAWMPVFRILGMQPWTGKLIYVSGAGQVFDAEGNLIDEQVKKLLTGYMTGFAAFVAASRR